MFPRLLLFLLLLVAHRYIEQVTLSQIDQEAHTRTAVSNQVKFIQPDPPVDDCIANLTRDDSNKDHVIICEENCPSGWRFAGMMVQVYNFDHPFAKIPAFMRPTIFFFVSTNISQILTTINQLKALGILDVKENSYLVVPDQKDHTPTFKKLWQMDVVKGKIIASIGSRVEVVEANPFSEGSGCGKEVIPSRSPNCPKGLAPERVPYENKFANCLFKVGVTSLFYNYPFLTNATSKNAGLILQPLLTAMNHLGVVVHVETVDEATQYALANNQALFASASSRLVLDSFLIFPLMSPDTLGTHDNTIPFYYAPSVWAAPSPKIISPIEILVVVYAGFTWLLILLVFALVMMVFYFMAKVADFEPLNDFSKCAMMVYQTTLSMGMTRWPAKRPISILLIFYMIYSVHVVVLYQGRLNSIMTSPVYEKGIRSFSDIVEEPIPVELHMYAVNFTLANRNDDAVKKIIEKLIIKTDDGMARILRLSEHQNFTTFIFRTYVDILKNLKVRIIEGDIATPALAYTISRTHPAVEEFKRCVAALVEGGFIEKWLNDLKVVLWNDSGDEVVPLSMKHLQGPFVILVFGLLVGTAAFIGEIIHARRAIRK